MKQLSFMKASFMGDPGNKRYNNHQIAMKGGSYSLAMTGIVLAILVVVNIFAVSDTHVTPPTKRFNVLVYCARAVSFIAERIGEHCRYTGVR